jgi:hypothetical protein
LPYHMPPPSLRLRRLLHRLIDPMRSLPNRRRAAHLLASLPAGHYSAGVEVPYVPQFASPRLIADYIHGRLHGSLDPNWQQFGAPDAETYTFWAQRSCAIACVKMAVDAFGTGPRRTLWEYVGEGLELGGYVTNDASGRFIDRGWYYPGLVALAGRHGLEVSGGAYMSLLNVCTFIRDGWLVAAAVTPEIGERTALRRYDGHFVLVYGFQWKAGRPLSVLLHNPSGRHPELQDGAEIASDRFRAAFAHRFIAFRGRDAAR